jgi:hypothetical protein
MSELTQEQLDKIAEVQAKLEPVLEQARQVSQHG